MSQIVAIGKDVLANLGDVIAGRPDVMPSPSPRLKSLGPPPSSSIFGAYDSFFEMVRTPDDRKKEMEYYDYLEREIPDVRKALDAYATMAVTGDLAGGGKQTYTVRLVNDESLYPEELKARLRDVERLIQAHAYPTVRTMAKYGSYMPELITGFRNDKRMGVIGINPIPPGTIFRKFGPGGQVDPSKYWMQVVRGKVQGPTANPTQTDPQNPAASNPAVEQWRLPHFAIWTNVVSATETLIYGTSLLQPVGAIALKLHAVVDSAVVARLSRAAMRYIWMVDVSDISNDHGAIRRRLKTWQDSLTRATNLLDNSQRDGVQKAPVPDGDFFVPSGEKLKYDLKTLDGDSNLSRVGDIDMLTKFYFGALGVPPEYLGHERSQGGRSNLSQIDINFARSSRHIQMFAAAGFEHIVYVDMILGGWDPRQYPIEVAPPPIGARDDLLQAQIRQFQSVVLMNLRTAGMQLELAPRWVMETFLNMHDDFDGLDGAVLDKLFAAPPAPAAPSDTPPAKVKEELDRIRDKMLAENGDIIDVMRESVRLLMGRGNPALYRANHPTPAQLAAQIGNR